MSLDRREARQQIRTFGNRALRIQVRITDHTVRIEQEHRSCIDAAFVVEYAVGLANDAVLAAAAIKALHDKGAV